MELADTLSRTYHPNMHRSLFQTEVEAIHVIQDPLPVGAARLENIRNQAKQDETQDEKSQRISYLDDQNKRAMSQMQQPHTSMSERNLAFKMV